jgi:chromosome partitioning protein
MAQPRIIALMNNKGGTGKTTLAYNIARNFSRNNRNVVCVDYDQQEQLQTMLPDITRSDLKAEDLPELESDYVIVDTGPTFQMEHLDLMDVSDLIIIPLQLEMLDIQQSVKLLKTIKRSNHQAKARIIVTHSGKHTLMYKTLMPALLGFADEFGIEIIAEMRKSQAVAQANLKNKTVFEISSPPEVRSEFKALFKEIGKTISEIAPYTVSTQNPSTGESCQAH